MRVWCFDYYVSYVFYGWYWYSECVFISRIYLFKDFYWFDWYFGYLFPYLLDCVNVEIVCDVTYVFRVVVYSVVLDDVSWCGDSICVIKILECFPSIVGVV